MADADGAVEVADNPAEHRYEIALDGTVIGFLLYKDRERLGRRVLVHTEVDPAYEGHGLGGKLIRGALDDVRARGLTAVPVCPFVTKFLRGHPEYLDVVEESHRAEPAAGS